MAYKTLILGEETLSKNDVLKVPHIIKNKVLMAPGTWNDMNYTSEDIKQAFENTNWSDKDVCSLILDHADKPLSLKDWVGWVKNPRFDEASGKVLGDLEFYDENILTKVLVAGARCGVSPKVRGDEMDGFLRNFTFENFSVVTNPAVKKAYINLSENYSCECLKCGHTIQTKEHCRDIKCPKCGGEMRRSERPGPGQENSNFKEVKGGLKKEMSEDKIEEKVDEKEKEEKSEVKEEEKDEESKESESEEEEKTSEEMSDLLEVSSNEDWPGFVKSMKEKKSDVTLSEIMKAYKEGREASAKLEELSTDEIVKRVNELTAVLKKRNNAIPEPKKDNTQEMANEIKDLKNQIKEMSAKMNEPDSKSVHNLSEQSYTLEEKHHSDGVMGMADFLKKLKNEQ